jgi:hypothetical protein
MTDNGERGVRRVSRLRSGIALAGFLLVAGYFLWTEHKAHAMAFLPYLPWLLLLACPLLHVFMHRGHGAHGGPDQGAGRPGGERERSDRSP